MQRTLIATLLTIIGIFSAYAQVYDESGNDVTGMNSANDRNGNFNPHSKDSTAKAKVIPKGIYVWTVDNKFGDIRPSEVDTIPHLFPLATMNTGLHGEYNTLGNNYSARQNRIFIDRPVQNYFPLIEAYSYVNKRPEDHHFTNTLSPITNLWYDNCGDKNTGEDHLDVKFAVNAGKRVGFGFDLNYAYARGYYQNQSNSHFCSTLYGSYLGDHYQAHVIFSTNHQKATENGGITDDNYITHPELAGQGQSYAENEIPTVLSQNWNRDHNLHFFLTHRYNVGFYREVMMTEEEIKAREFARKSKQEQEGKDSDNKKQLVKGRLDDKDDTPKGRPDNAMIAGNEPASLSSDTTLVDSTRISVTSAAMADSLMAAEAKQDSINDLMKKEFVPVTSFIHTLEFDHFDHDYLAYVTPTNYYEKTYYNLGPQGLANDSINDKLKHLNLKNTLAIGLLEGFNKWAKAGVKAFATHQLRRYDMADIEKTDTAVSRRWTEHNISIGGKLSKTQGQTLHYELMGEVWMAGEDAGQLKIDAQTDLNFPLLGDTVRLAAKGYFYRLNPDFLFRHFHSKHIWWDNDGLSMTTRTRAEGLFSYEKTHTKLRIGLEEIQNYTYLGMSYDADTKGRTMMNAQVIQQSSNINVLTAQLEQPLSLGPLHWDNIVTYQSSSSKEALPLPLLNVFSNLYLKFKYAGVLTVELGAAATYFTEYEAPDFCPVVNQFAIQQNADSRVKLGNQPFVDVYANLHLKHARFFLMMSNITGTSMHRMSFLTPHYPMNNSIMHFGVSWNFFN